MSLTIDATVGGASANSFVTLAEANAYMAARLNTDAWTDADDAGVALAEATRELGLCRWLGLRVDDTQALAWPRQLVLDPDSPSRIWYAETVIPQRVKDATCELALEFLRAGTTDIAGRDTSRDVVRKRVDVLETEYAPAAQRAAGLARYPRIMGLIAPLLATVGGSTFNVVRG